MAKEIEDRATMASGQGTGTRAQNGVSGLHTFPANAKPSSISTATPNLPGHGIALPKCDMGGPNSPPGSGGPSNGLRLPPKSERIRGSLKSYNRPHRNLARNGFSCGMSKDLIPEDGCPIARSIDDETPPTHGPAAMTVTTNLHFSDAQDCGKVSDVSDWFGAAEAGEVVFDFFLGENSLLAGIGSRF